MPPSPFADARSRGIRPHGVRPTCPSTFIHHDKGSTKAIPRNRSVLDFYVLPVRLTDDLSAPYRDFSPAWFTVIMGTLNPLHASSLYACLTATCLIGTGIVDSLFLNFPYGTPSVAFRTISAIVFFLNFILFCVFTAISIFRLIVFPNIWGILVRDSVSSIYIATFPLGANTLLTVAVNLIYKQYHFGGRHFLYTIWALWLAWLAISAISCWGIIHMMITHQHHEFARMSALTILPTVTLTVAAATGANVTLALLPISPRVALVTATLSTFSLIVGLVMLFLLMGIYLFKLIIHGNPPGLLVASTFLPIGETAQPGYAVLLVGQAFKQLIPVHGNTSFFLSTPAVGEIVYATCVCVGFALWAITTMWAIFMVLAVQHELRKGIPPFKLAWWSAIFPMGTYANFSILLYRDLDAGFFRVFGSIVAVVTWAMWLSMLVGTLYMVYTDQNQMFERQGASDVGFDEMRIFRSLNQSLGGGNDVEGQTLQGSELEKA
ncbi:hypothetical protein FA95DRAFT_347400 [Auriscalpium vulgare]|uniref:Uncharacterized protein n=1 Tax=Auriscalpium vulgare TaxID=40419 RepID=A0ACB8RHZ9_9AGAM|nr:hypothetical protein FA95DRAFT_347400 [Auriscalpium vulgare]